MSYRITDPEAVGNILADGGVVGLPTESTFGLVARVDRPDAITRILALKSARTDPIPLIASDKAMVVRWTREFPCELEALADQYWPGPLTVVLAAAAGVPDQVSAGTGTIGVRVPGMALLREFIEAEAVPLTATSANPSGMPPATTVERFLDYFPEVPVWAGDDGPGGGKPSTVVGIRDGRVHVFRDGPIIIS